MRKGLLTLLGLLSVGAAAASAQPAANNPPFAMATPMSSAPVQPAAAPTQPVAPAGGRYSPPGDVSWEKIVLAAAGPSPPANRPAGDAEPESPANRFWIDTDYLLWWTKNGPLPVPLLTTGPASAPIIGGLTQPGTTVLFGGSSQNYGMSNGLRVDTGIWLDSERDWGLNSSFFILEQRARVFQSNSNASGRPVLAQPLIDPATGQEFTEVIALPGLISGSAVIATQTRLRGWEINGLANVVRTEQVSFDLLGGFRAVSLDEDFTDLTAFSPLVNSFLTFPGRTVNTGSTLVTFDGYHAQNHFYGFQMGGRLAWTFDKLTISAVGKFALGSEQELVRVVGDSALVTPGSSTVIVPGGVLAVSSNIGEHFRNDFAVLPEGQLQVKYRISTHIEAQCGYSLLYISRVVRPGNQISRAVEPGQIPTDPAFGTGTATAAPFQFRASDYWAQGFNFGLLFRF